jgi:hypothetical protein
MSTVQSLNLLSFVMSLLTQATATTTTTTAGDVDFGGLTAVMSMMLMRIGLLSNRPVMEQSTF